MEVASIRPILAPATSIVCAVLIFLTGRSTFQRRLWSILASVTKFLIVISMLPGSLRGVIYTSKLVTMTPNIVLEFRVDALGQFFSLVSSTLWIVTTIYAIGYMEPEHHKVRFFGFFALCVSTTVGIAYAGNLFTLFIFYEMLTICTYPLVIHEETPEAMKAGRKYLIYTLTGGVVILLAMALTYHLAGNLSLGQTGILSVKDGVNTLRVLFAMYMVGFGVKAAIMPLHGWLPSAMVAPVPVSSLLHAVAVVKAGAFGILRVIYNVFGAKLVAQLGVGEVLVYAAVITIIGGSVMALLQDNLKRRLAYSTVSQLSYIVLGAALLTPAAATASVVHLANQAFQKITLFFCAGAIQRRTGIQKVSEMAGLGFKMPLTMATFTVAALGFMGVPIFAGFITKFYLSLGALAAQKPWIVVVMMVSALLNAAYFLPPIYLAFFKDPLDKDKTFGESKWSLLFPCLITALYVVLLGAFANTPGLPLALASKAVDTVFGLRLNTVVGLR
jgi:multicomponent Na+:H+ antiporter subunit D